MLCCSLGALVWALSGTVHAGPMEILDAASIGAGDAVNIVLSYTNGGQGIFVSQDGGAKLSWLCHAGVTPKLNNNSAVAFASGDGSLYLGSYFGLFRADADGCNVQLLPELHDRVVKGFASDPFDAKRTYLITSTPPMKGENGLYVSAGAGAFEALGATVPKFLDSLHVVKLGAARRFYVTATAQNIPANRLDYSVRVSDDDGATWSDEAFDLAPFETGALFPPVFSIVGVDPLNPDHVFANLSRGAEPDVIVYSVERGKAGSWKELGQPGTFGGLAVTPDGRVFFGDDQSTTRGLFVVDALGEPAKLLNDSKRVTCLAYDAVKQRLLGCSDNYRFGVFDTGNGELTTLLDMRCAEHAVTCPEQPGIMEICQPPGVEFCKLDHWLLAPLCKVYDRGPDFAYLASTAGYTCDGGKTLSTSPSAAGAGSREALPSAAAGAAGGGGEPRAGGCGCSSVRGTGGAGVLWLGALLAFGRSWRRRALR
jgi:hypothetical protein